jgi:hypothetical protein
VRAAYRLSADKLLDCCVRRLSEGARRDLTEKGSISQRGIAQRHADLVEELYANKPTDNIICAGFRKPRIGSN